MPAAAPSSKINTASIDNDGDRLLLEQAATAGQRGDHAKVEALCGRLLRRGAAAEPLRLLALSRLARQEHGAARGLLRRALALEPSSPAILGGMAITLSQTGQARERDSGLAWFSRHGHLSPGDTTAALNWARALLRLPDPRRAVEVLERATRRNPLDYGLMFELAGACQKAGDTEAAAHRYLAAAALAAGRHEPWHALASLYEETERPAAAQQAMRHAVQRAPGRADLLGQLGNLLKKTADRPGTLAAFRVALALEPDKPGRYRLAAEAARDADDRPTSAALYLKALRLEPGCAGTANNASAVFNDLGRLEEAGWLARRALTLEPALPEALGSVANACDNRDDLAGSIRWNRRAFRLRRDYQEAHWNLSLALLRASRWEEGWPEYEWRLHASAKPTAFSAPRWSGEPLQGRTLLLRCEQGHGDMIQFLRFLPDPERLGGPVVLEIHPALARMAAENFPKIQVVARGTPFPRHHLQHYLMSLPHLLGLGGDLRAGRPPYLTPPPAAAASWRARLAGENRLKVGIAWAGEPDARYDWRRSLSLSTLAPLGAVPDVALFSLQKGPAAEQPRPAGLAIADHMPEMRDFADTAALMAGLDLVVAVDTAVVHLAGALGVPVWVISRHDACWRWGLRSDRSPWYPTMRLFYQPARGRWPELVAEVAEELAAAVADRSRLRPPPARIAPRTP